MEYRRFGNTGLKVSELSFGTATFGGSNDFFKAWGNTQDNEAKRLVDICIDQDINLFDTANVYSDGLAESILGKALGAKRKDIVLSTKATFPTGQGVNDYGSSAVHLMKACDESLRRLGTDYIDVYHMHGFDANTPVEETLSTLDRLIQSGKVRYIACSNFSGWHLMKSLSVSEKNSWSKYVVHQVYYSLLNREFEWELMPLGIDQNMGTMVWSPLSSGLLSGKYRREIQPENGRIAEGGSPLKLNDTDKERMYDIVDVLIKLSEELGKTPAQIAIRWLLQRPTISNVIIGARNEEQLVSNFGAVGWSLTLEQIKMLDKVSDVDPIYPYSHQKNFPMLNAVADLYK
ncbi:Predicted oxidoreductase [Chryseobacterium arachidis]|uniref:Predicted oxidoreductase n=1 Tax=Chryseobacterium arachidis TaxID=1416778 RepID=A0A1M5MEH7_9FLAO|nr:aldo/keto reductase [Chryseobacterium arachidis]SHG75621.1 Predicted oxidoreductase [Chryseobacterium arachidis]